MNMNDFFEGLAAAIAEDVPGATLTVEAVTPEQLAETIKTEIKELVAAGVIPADVPDFTVLHDYVDANVLGVTEELFNNTVTASETEEEHQAKLDAMMAIANPAMDIVDAWIKAGGIKQ